MCIRDRVYYTVINKKELADILVKIQEMCIRDREQSAQIPNKNRSKTRNDIFNNIKAYV